MMTVNSCVLIFLQFLSLQPAYYGVMVTSFHGIVDIAATGFVMAGAKNIVDAEIEAFLPEGVSGAVAALNVTIGQVAAYFAPDVGDGGIVEVAADNKRIVAMGFNIAADSFSLLRTLNHGQAQLAKQ